MKTPKRITAGSRKIFLTLQALSDKIRHLQSFFFKCNLTQSSNLRKALLRQAGLGRQGADIEVLFSRFLNIQVT